MTTIRLATRGSAQAKKQSEFLAQQLIAADADLVIELVFVETLGDKKADTPLHEIGGQGIFVKEVQRAVLDGHADIAVHSAKDLPSEQQPGLLIAAFTERRTANDALVGSTLDGLASGATVATGSVRRRAQLARLRPDLQFIDLRGNINTRLEKIPHNGAIVMAVAALEVLDLQDRITQVLSLDDAVPMIGQGCVAVEARAQDDATRTLLQIIDHAPTRRAVETERAFLAELGAGCTAPIAAHVSPDHILRAFMANDSTSVQLTGSILGIHDHLEVGREIARECQKQLRRGRRS
ncbi:MAG: hydroxymethylbilane synthase [Ilumatobacteraceae bacterium]|nr:hydroxymethylbilane synthase [Ilumatobacteraceae bacterium]